VRTWPLTTAMVLWSTVACADGASDRIRADAEAGKPLVVHVLVALCDNVHQGIVPVPARLGNGSDPDNNLYWGARYGIRGYLSQAPGWKRVSLKRTRSATVLERAVFVTKERGKSLYVVADAWDGSRIQETISAFLEMASGRQAEVVRIGQESLSAGGDSHVVVFIGHNGLMNFDPPLVMPGRSTPARTAAVLACASKPYFEELLRRAGAVPLLLTTGLMAPEAYSLEAGLRQWVATGEVRAARVAAADAYQRYQRCGQHAARQLFAVGDAR
jgi:hypothetical protein